LSAQHAMQERLTRLERTVDSHIASLTSQLKRVDAWIGERAAREEANAQVDAQQVARAEATARTMDEFYAELEQAFRGSRDEIKSRVAVYLPLLEEAAAGNAAWPVLDLGCGRGEWLEVLREHGLQATGIDTSDASCAECRERGLDVVQADALAYISALPDACLGAVSGMHIAEHLPFEQLLELTRQCVRVLLPGGVLILETPNPGNVLVATNSFYLDPTHRNPIPAALLKLLLESQGLDRVEILELTRYPRQWSSVESEVDRYLVANLFGAEDYAAIGRKPFAGQDASHRAGPMKIQGGP